MKPIARLEYVLTLLQQRPIAIDVAGSAIRAAIRQIETLERDLAIARAGNGIARTELLGAVTFPPLIGDA